MAEPRTRRREHVRDLDVGDRFRMDGRCWTVSYADEYRVEARESQFSTIRTFYDPVTARKAGEFSYEQTVEMLP